MNHRDDFDAHTKLCQQVEDKNYNRFAKLDELDALMRNQTPRFDPLSILSVVLTLAALAAVLFLLSAGAN